MAITINTSINPSELTKIRKQDSETDGVIFQVDPSRIYKVQVVNTAAGSANVGGLMDTDEPTDFTDFSFDQNGSYTSSFEIDVTPGNQWIGVDVISGTWDVKIKAIR